MAENSLIIPVEMSDGDPGYFAEGHMDKGKFVALVNSEFEEEFTEEDVEHIYQTKTQPARLVGGKMYDNPDSDEPCWWPCQADDEGAFPCTFVRP